MYICVFSVHVFVCIYVRTCVRLVHLRTYMLLCVHVHVCLVHMCVCHVTMREHGVIMGYCVPEEPTCVVTVHD